MTLKAVILNDTRGDNHFGCFRVMRTIEENLASRNMEVLARSLVRNDWERDRSFLAAMAKSDVVVINGEGTLHHGAAQGEKLLKVVDHPARGDKPVALINALYQENPADWRPYLERMALISTRDSWSAEAAAKDAGRPVDFVPDLSLANGFARAEPGIERDLLLVGDSVSRDVSKFLKEIAFSRKDARLLPILRTLKSSKPHYPLPLWLLREAYIRLHAMAAGIRHPNIRFSKNEAEFIDALQHAYLHVTGRFHAACFCLFTETPFLAVDSNSWKIGAMLNDFGLPRNRLVRVEALKEMRLDRETAPYSEAERAAISNSLAMAEEKTAQMFDTIRDLAARRRGP